MPGQRWADSRSVVAVAPSFGHGYAYVYDRPYRDAVKVQSIEPGEVLFRLIQKPYAPRVLVSIGYVRNVGATGSNPVTSTTESDN
jgi:hypothetical protein